MADSSKLKFRRPPDHAKRPFTAQCSPRSQTIQTEGWRLVPSHGSCRTRLVSRVRSAGLLPADGLSSRLGLSSLYCSHTCIRQLHTEQAEFVPDTKLILPAMHIAEERELVATHIKLVLS